MKNENIGTLSALQKSLLIKLLELKEASIYTLRESVGSSYATVHFHTKRLLEYGLLKQTAKMMSSKGGMMIRYTLTEKGQDVAKEVLLVEEQRELGSIKSRLLTLANAGANPSLKKKVAELEKELIVIHAHSITASKASKKEDEGALRNYQQAKRRAFVIMPSEASFEDVWRGAIERACNSEEISSLRVDQVSLSMWITEGVEKYMEMADVVILDITGNNPNVMFELGWALGRNKNPIVIRQADDSHQIPFDVMGIRYVSYANTWSGIEGLYQNVRRLLEVALKTHLRRKDPETKQIAKGMQMLYEVNLEKIDGEGEFTCPKCGAIISPDDETEETYQIVEAIDSEGEIIELGLLCKKCLSRIRVVGFAPSHKTSRIEPTKKSIRAYLQSMK